MARDVDLACFSYLAATRVLLIDRYPALNNGAEIRASRASVAGDGPLVAAFGSGLGLSVALESNQLGRGERAGELRAFLTRHAIASEVAASDDRTPEAIILADPTGNREWFVDYANARQELNTVGGRYLTAARLAYIDCFESIAEASARALTLAADAGVPIYANVGASSLDRWRRVLPKDGLAIVQASLDESRHGDAVDVAAALCALGAETAVVTSGIHGAVACRGGAITRAPARAVEIDHTHGAGAGFAAGFIFATLTGRDLPDALAYGCALGSMQCSHARLEAPTTAAVERFIAATRPARP